MEGASRRIAFKETLSPIQRKGLLVSLLGFFAVEVAKKYQDDLDGYADDEDVPNGFGAVVVIAKLDAERDQ